MHKKFILAILVLLLIGFTYSAYAIDNISNFSETQNNVSAAQSNISENSGVQDNVSAVATLYIAKKGEKEEEPKFLFLDNAKNYFFVFWSNKTLRVVVPALIFLIVLFVYLRTRDTLANNVKKARRYHKLAKEHHDKGNEEKAKEFFEMSRFYREKNL